MCKGCIRQNYIMSLIIVITSLVISCIVYDIQIMPIQAHATDFLDGIKLEDTSSEDGNQDVKLNVGKIGTDEGKMDFNQVLSKYKYIVMAFTGILTITMFAAMIYMFSKLGIAGDNEAARRKAIGGILTTGIATALLGSSTIIIGFFYSSLG